MHPARTFELRSNTNSDGNLGRANTEPERGENVGNLASYCAPWRVRASRESRLLLRALTGFEPEVNYSPEFLGHLLGQW